MCGIAGFINFHSHDKSEARERLQRMTSTLVHRGPDDAGYYVDECAALGHRRLAIIDLRFGQQPMGVLDDQVHIVFNGEIYNFLELRVELENRGHRFSTRSDTEVIIRGYVEWGEQCVEKLNGMFAFAIWDARHRKLLLARDRVGKKPLYYYQVGQTIAFASELKALRVNNCCPDAIDPEALDCYFTFGYIPAPRTIYKNVKKLSPAVYRVVSANTVTEKRYWHVSFANPIDRTLDQATDEFEVLLDDAVRCRLMSDVPLGVFLSGGLDSSLVVSSMGREMRTPVMTNSIGFDDKNFDELPLSRAVSSHLQTNHREFVVKPHITEVLDRIAWHFDEPFADSSAVPTWYVCQMARQNVTVALSGDGGDESFGGYTFRYIPHVLESRIRAALPALLRRAMFGMLGTVWPGAAWFPKPLRLKTILENLAVSDAEAFYRDLVFLRSDTREGVYSADFMNALNGFVPMEVVSPLYVGNDAKGALGRSQFTDIHFYMSEDVLVKVDRMSMAHSLEVRAPLLDYRVIEFAAKLPERMKLNARKGKLVLRQLAKRRLPLEVRNAPKRGFSVPAATWLRNELKAKARDLIFERSLLISNFLDKKRLEALWCEHQRGARDHSVFLWGLMMFGLWEQNAASLQAPPGWNPYRRRI
jgi:asparagine synthase (glutamine-hydrolysing)